jgi:hypothetical protein
MFADRGETVFSQIKGVAQRARTPLSGTLLPNLLHLLRRLGYVLGYQ